MPPVFMALDTILSGIQVAQFIKPAVPDNYQHLPMPGSAAPAPTGSSPSPSPDPSNPTGNPHAITQDPWGWLKWELGVDPGYWAKNLPAVGAGLGEIGLTLILVAILLIAIAAMLTGGNPVAYVSNRLKEGVSTSE